MSIWSKFWKNLRGVSKDTPNSYEYERRNNLIKEAEETFKDADEIIQSLENGFDQLESMFKTPKSIKRTPLVNRKDYWNEVFKTYNIQLNVNQIGPNSTIINVPEKGILKVVKDEYSLYSEARQSATDCTTSLWELKDLDKKHNLGLFPANLIDITVVNQHDIRLVNVDKYKSAFLTIDEIAKIDGINVTPYKNIKFGQ